MLPRIELWYLEEDDTAPMRSTLMVPVDTHGNVEVSYEALAGLLTKAEFFQEEAPDGHEQDPQES